MPGAHSTRHELGVRPTVGQEGNNQDPPDSQDAVKLLQTLAWQSNMLEHTTAENYIHALILVGQLVGVARHREVQTRVLVELPVGIPTVKVVTE